MIVGTGARALTVVKVAGAAIGIISGLLGLVTQNFVIALNFIGFYGLLVAAATPTWAALFALGARRAGEAFGAAFRRVLLTSTAWTTIFAFLNQARALS